MNPDHVMTDEEVHRYTLPILEAISEQRERRIASEEEKNARHHQREARS